MGNKHANVQNCLLTPKEILTKHKIFVGGGGDSGDTIALTFKI